MADSIQDRLKRVPPFDDDVKVLREVKEAASQQTQTYQPVKAEEAPQEEEITKEGVAAPEDDVTPPEPTEVSDRTKQQFDKLKDSNQELKTEKEELEKKNKELENVLDSLKPKTAPFIPPAPNIPEIPMEITEKAEKVSTELNQDQVDDIYSGLIDENGYIDPDLLIKTLKSANQEAKAARAEAESARKEAEQARGESERKFRDFEESREVRKVHRKYPQIDPKSQEFNEMFWDDVRKEIATAPILKGENVTFMDAADKIWNERYASRNGVGEVKKEDKIKMETAEDQKRNINATSKSARPSSDYAPSDTAALTEAMRLGKRGALAEMLKRVGQ